MTGHHRTQTPFNTILFSNERILTEREKQTILENKNSSDNLAGQLASRDHSVDYCKK